MAVRFSADGEDYSRTISLGTVTAFSIACWVKLSTDRNTNVTVWELTDGLDEDYAMLRTGADGTSVSFQQVDDGFGDPLRGTRNLTVGTWYYVAVAVNGANGVMLTRSLTDTSFTVSTWSNGTAGGTVQDIFRLGESDVSGEWLDGCLAAFKHWTTNLSQAELEAEFGFYQPRRTANLRAWYPFTRNETTDYSGNGQTLSGGANTSTEDGPGISWRPTRRKVRTPLSVSAEATPGPVTAPWSVPAPGISLGTGVQPGPVIAPWSVPTPDVFTGTTPPTQVQPGPVIAPWSVPTPAVSVSVNVHAAPVVAAWSLPSPGVVVPINPGDDLDGPGQLSFNGFKMGSGTPYRLVQLVGADIDLPALDNGNVPHPTEDGAMSGEKLALPRIIEATFLVSVPREQMREVMEDLRQNTPKAEADEELSLAIQVLDRIYITEGAVMRRSPGGIERRYRIGHASAVVVQWECSDPRLFDRSLQNAVIADGGTVTVHNAGNTSVKPIIRFPGPATQPRIEIERTLGDGSTDLRVLEFDVTVGSGQALVVDVKQLTAVIGATSHMNALTGASAAVKDWVLGRGDSSISYETTGGTAPAALVFWRHGWI
ncbi:LamG-like jellyroll fold domain-containing protein [Nonomuraea lactucae]|uniref:LamG-like jellyroll fold domain-containing protein n=1 Tax=Nonomuraea lactucae TaxID=2249762 RepID=UPI000DE43C62|nr:LamG-like jellyroll fold domain-containing protein [Nonomuraea lactucae]